MASRTTRSVPPPRYKTALLTWIGIYPVIALLLVVLGGTIGRYPAAVRALVLTAFAVPILTWLVMPVLSRVAAGWLYPERVPVPVADPSSTTGRQGCDDARQGSTMQLLAGNCEDGPHPPEIGVFDAIDQP
jgi:hypothetical protein